MIFNIQKENGTKKFTFRTCYGRGYKILGKLISFVLATHNHSSETKYKGVKTLKNLLEVYLAYMLI